MHKILLVEDDLDYGTVIKQYLEICGFSILWLTTPTDVFKILEQDKYSLAILDIMLPIQDGFNLSKDIRLKYPHIPFLFLTAKNQNIDRLMGLKLGAEDYISKTCDPEELKLRIENIIKRNTVSIDDKYYLGAYTFYPMQLKLVHSKETFRLTEREKDLLLLFIQYNKKVLPREVILTQLWPSADYFNGRSMDVFVTRLRKYLSYDDNVQIKSIRGVGFQINIEKT